MPVLCQRIAGQHEGRFQENLRVFYEVLDEYGWCVLMRWGSPRRSSNLQDWSASFGRRRGSGRKREMMSELRVGDNEENSLLLTRLESAWGDRPSEEPMPRADKTVDSAMDDEGRMREKEGSALILPPAGTTPTWSADHTGEWNPKTPQTNPVDLKKVDTAMSLTDSSITDPQLVTTKLNCSMDNTLLELFPVYLSYFELHPNKVQINWSNYIHKSKLGSGFVLNHPKLNRFLSSQIK